MLNSGKYVRSGSRGWAARSSGRGWLEYRTICFALGPGVRTFWNTVSLAVASQVVHRATVALYNSLETICGVLCELTRTHWSGDVQDR